MFFQTAIQPTLLGFYIQNKSADLRQKESVPENGWLDWLPEFNRTFQRYIRDRIFVNLLSVFLEMWTKLWESALSCSVEKSSKFPEPDSDADDFQKFKLTSDTSPVKFSW